METPRPAETITLPARGWQITPYHALIAGLLCWAGFAAVAWAVHSGTAAGPDAAGLRYWRNGATLAWAGGPASLEAVRDITALGGVTLRVIFSIGALLALLFLRLRREAVLLLLTLVSGLLVELSLKALVGRPRPALVPHLEYAGGSSFPSGHSFNSALGFIAVALAFATLSSRRSVRWTIIGAAMAGSLAVAFSRVMLGVHYPTDVIAGWLGGAGWAFLAEAALYSPARSLADMHAAALESATPGRTKAMSHP
ncbi:phosphatase PAP2 family protein [Novosphingobium sp.]|uniref:phosphatase PAP2 family protein n=1 Tax=Novosphingobium sp. TaxID=1874826 RepID=UPI0025F15BE1|nr:phosphatase PAP2 family protein [Novosphingobium sp.]